MFGEHVLPYFNSYIMVHINEANSNLNFDMLSAGVNASYGLKDHLNSMCMCSQATYANSTP